VRDAPRAKIIRVLNEKEYCNIIAYDPVAMEEFKANEFVFVLTSRNIGHAVVIATVLA